MSRRRCRSAGCGPIFIALSFPERIMPIIGLKVMPLHTTRLVIIPLVAIKDRRRLSYCLPLLISNPDLTSITSFGATVCNTVLPMLPNRCLSVLSVTLVYCGQTVGWIKMPLGTEIDLGPDHTVLDGHPAPRRKGAQQPPHFRSLRTAGKPASV